MSDDIQPDDKPISQDNLPPGLDPQTTAVLEVTSLICAKHGEPFRNEWPKGVARIVGLFHEWWSRNLDAITPEIMAKHAENKTASNPTSDAAAAFSILVDRPFCCRLSEAELLHLYIECKIGTTARCQYCGNTRPGSPIMAVNHWGRRVKRWKHLCFLCSIKHLQNKPRE